MPHPNWAVRPIRTGDIDAFFDLAASIGPGMTTFPADLPTLQEKIACSVASFDGTATRLDAQYVLVLEDLDSGDILGTSALYSNVGSSHGFYSYKRIRQVHRSQALDFGSDVELLTLANDYTGATEIGTLAVRPHLKGTGAGRLLARARYMLIATRPDLFAPVLMAEMRGWQAGDGRSPFWDAVGARFFRMDFATADRVSALRGADFIADLLPRHPVYIDLLPDEARAVIGRPHEASAPALAMLRREGFRFEGYVDVFDAGPQVHVERDNIETVRRSRLAAVQPLSPSAAPTAPPVIVCIDDLARFRVISTNARISQDEIALDPQAIAALGAERFEPVRWSPGRVGPEQ
nr:arginine N-succinyltransferase [Sphingomonas sp. Y57]